MIGWLVAVSGMLALTFGIAAGQQDGPGAPPVLPSSAVASDSIVVAATTTADVELDGKLDEAVWATADSIYIFRQREPNSGAAASERTVVRVARDHDALYIAVRASDSTSSGAKHSPGYLRQSRSSAGALGACTATPSIAG